MLDQVWGRDWEDLGASTFQPSSLTEIEGMFNGIRCSIGKCNKCISGIFNVKDFGGA